MAQKVLVVDDEVYIRTLLKQVLEDFSDLGVDVLTANDVPQAEDVIEKDKPDVLILDIMLPGPSGYELCRRIKATPRLKDIYVIVLTAKSQAVDRIHSMEAGADEYIPKPFKTRELVERVAAALGIERV